MTGKQTPPGSSWRGSENVSGSGPIVPSGLSVDGPRPGVAWVVGLPADWVTTTQRLVLLVLACDAFDTVSRPGEDALMRWCGLRSRSTLYDALAALAAPVEGVRPALLGRTSHLRKRTTYQLLVSGQPDASAVPDASGDVSGYASGVPDPPFPFPTSTHLGNSGTDRAREGSGDDGAKGVITVDPLCEEGTHNARTPAGDDLHTVETPHPLRSRHEIRAEAVGE